MSDTVIEIQNVSKIYRLGEIGTGTLTHDLNRWWHRVRGHPDPYLKLGQVNDRATKGQSNYVWAVKDVSFNVARGEVLGIIGSNGAGKSTLLKILSRVTMPTSGQIRAKGRIASLLEVGTGFHPELTGRDNIFLNGAILGMRKREIDAKFDEIVNFAGVERFVDTPVKRYSSGMRVRLGFAVAAYLEPEILIVDEVLAVGDAEFQKKCLGKMKDVAGHGRTVLLVSHQLGSIMAFCQKVVWMASGKCHAIGDAREIGNAYLNASQIPSQQRLNLAAEPRSGTDGATARIVAVEWLDGLPLRHGCPTRVRLEIAFTGPIQDVRPGFAFGNMDGMRLVSYNATAEGGFNVHHPSTGIFDLYIDSLPLNPGVYSLEVGCRSGELLALDFLSEVGSVEVIPGPDTPSYFLGKQPAVRLAGRWRTASEPSAINTPISPAAP